MMRRYGISARIGAIAATAAVALTLGACSAPGGNTGSTGDANAPVKLTMGAVFTTSAVPMWIADSEGFFKKQGLEVTIKQAPNFAASAPSLLNGQLQFANAATGPVVSAVDKGMPLKIVAGVQAKHEDPAISDDQVVVRPGSEIKRPRDLEGKTVAVNAVGSGPYVGVTAEYLKDGGTRDGIKWIVMNLSEQVAAIESGKVDAAIMSEPFVAIARKAGLQAAFSPYRAPGVEAVPARFSDAVLVASSEYIAKNPDVVRRVHNAMVDANNFAQQNPEKVRELLVKKLEMDPGIVKDVRLPLFVGEVDPANVQSMVDLMQGINLIGKKIDAKDFVWQP